MRMAPMTAKPAISAQGGADTQEEGVGISPALAGRDGDVSAQAVAGGENPSA